MANRADHPRTKTPVTRPGSQNKRIRHTQKLNLQPAKGMSGKRRPTLGEQVKR